MPVSFERGTAADFEHAKATGFARAKIADIAQEPSLPLWFVGVFVAYETNLLAGWKMPIPRNSQQAPVGKNDESGGKI